ncbi:hypothetical protein GCM10029964_074240 [Kibdelosporangium lantanae]
MPLFETARHGVVPPLGQVHQLMDYVRRLRLDPFEVVLGGATDAATAADVVGPLAEAGVTWWDERQLQTSPDLDRFEPVMRRVSEGPPRL